MNNIFIKYLDKFILVFIDDILVYSKIKEEHEEHQLYAKFSKCYFYKPQIHYLGHIIFNTWIAVDPKNIRSIEDYPTPTSFIDITYFLGLSVYYGKFIENFSRIDFPMTTLQKKENNFLWMTKCDEIFQKLKQLLTTALILWIAEPNGDFVVCMDSRKEGFRGLLL